MKASKFRAMSINSLEELVRRAAYDETGSELEKQLASLGFAGDVLRHGAHGIVDKALCVLKRLELYEQGLRKASDWQRANTLPDWEAQLDDLFEPAIIIDKYFAKHPMGLGCSVTVCTHPPTPDRSGVIVERRVWPVGEALGWGVHSPGFQDLLFFFAEPEDGKHYNPNRAYWMVRS